MREYQSEICGGIHGNVVQLYISPIFKKHLVIWRSTRLYHLCRKCTHQPTLHLTLHMFQGVSRGNSGIGVSLAVSLCTHRLVCRHPFQHQLPSIITLIHRCSERLRDPSVGSVPISRNPLASWHVAERSFMRERLTTSQWSLAVCYALFLLSAVATASAAN